MSCRICEPFVHTQQLHAERVHEFTAHGGDKSKDKKAKGPPLTEDPAAEDTVEPSWLADLEDSKFLRALPAKYRRSGDPAVVEDAIKLNQDYNNLAASTKLSTSRENFIDLNLEAAAVNRSKFGHDVCLDEPTLAGEDSTPDPEKYYLHQKSLGHFRNTTFEEFSTSYARSSKF